MNAVNIIINFVMNSLILGVIGIGIAVNHDNSVKLGFLIGASLGVIYTIWAIFNGFLAPIF